MPTRVPSVRRPWWCLAVALCLTLGGTPRADAKPPDLPQPTDYEFAPGDKVTEHAEGSPVPLSPADRCAAQRTITRCILFGLNPLAPLTRADRYLEYDDTPSAPILHVGDHEIGVGDVLRDAVVAICTGPFGPISWQLQTGEAPTQPAIPAGEEDQDENVEFVPTPPASMGPCPSHCEKDFCPRTHECPAPSPSPSTPPRNEQAGVAEQYLILAQILANGGHFGEACECYQRVCALCPGTCIAQEAMKRMQALYFSMYQDAAQPAAGEEQEPASVCPAAEHQEKLAEDESSSSRSFIENIEALEKSGRLYEQAEALMHEGKVDEACALYEKIRELCPGHRYAKMAAERIEELQGLRTRPVEGTHEKNEAHSVGEMASGDNSTPAASKAKEFPSQMVVRWHNEVMHSPDPSNGTTKPSLIGRIYLFGQTMTFPLEGDGTVSVELFNPAEVVPPGTEGTPKGGPRRLELWTIDAVTLQKLRHKDLVGWGYNLALPWGTYRPELTRLQMRVCYQPAKGKPFSEIGTLILSQKNQPEGSAAASAGEVFGAIDDLAHGCWDAFLSGSGAVSPSADATQRMGALLNSSEDLRQIENEWAQFWFTDQPSHMSYDRLHGITEAGASADKKVSLEERLDLPVSLNCKDAVLTRLIDDLRAWRGINIVLDRKALDDKGISPDVKINVRIENVSLKSALNLVLRQAGLTWKIQDEVVLITTPHAARPALVRHIYKISDLVRADRSSGKGKKGSKGETEAEAADEIIALIEDTIAPQSWIGVGGDCAIEYFSRGRALVVNQVPEVHEQIADMLATLRRHLKSEEAEGSEEASSIEPEVRRPLVDAGYDISDVLATHQLDLDPKTDRAQVRGRAVPAEELIALIRDGVAPSSWDVHGGRGTINYNPNLKTLFIEQTAEVHEAIQELLDARRREIERHKKECERQAEDNGKTGGVEQQSYEKPTPSCCPAQAEHPELFHEVSGPTCDAPPDDAAVLRALPPLVKGTPHIYEENRDDIQIVKERLVDKIDPPRFFPLVGMARLHHCQYKCTVYYTETCQSDYPLPFKVVKPRVQVVYIDRDRLQIEEHVPPAVQKPILHDLIEEPGSCCPALPGLTQQLLQSVTSSPNASEDLGEAWEEMHVCGQTRSLLYGWGFGSDAGATGQTSNVPHLVEKCRDALKTGRLEKAKMLAALAFSADPVSAIQDSFVSLMWLLGEPCPPAGRAGTKAWLGFFSEVEIFGGYEGTEAEKQVVRLLEQCRLALNAGQLAEAEMFASRALAIDPLLTAANPLVYKMHLLHPLNTQAVQLRPSLPAIDVHVVPASNEIFDKPDGDLACCEEEEEIVAESVKPNICFDFDQHKDGAVRVRCQLGRFCFRLDCDQQKHGSLLFGLGIDSDDPVSQFLGSALEGVFKAFDSVSKPDEKNASDSE